MRCLTLAQALKANGHAVTFICREYPGNLIGLIRDSGFPVSVLSFEAQEAYTKQSYSDDYSKWLWVSISEDVDQTLEILKAEKAEWLIVDHYALDIDWEKRIRPYVDKIMAIDDLANRKHDCDILLDQNFYLDLEHRYDHLVPKTCTKLLGPKYVLLRPEILEIREKRKALGKFVPHAMKNILVYMGGADPKNFTAQTIEVLIELPNIQDYHIDVIVGVINPHKKDIAELCNRNKLLHYHEQPSYYFDLLLKADLAIAAGGSGALERIAIGLSSITLVIADNQFKASQDLSRTEQIILWENWINLSENLSSIEKNYKLFVSNNLKLIDGLGVRKILKIMGVGNEG